MTPEGGDMKPDWTRTDDGGFELDAGDGYRATVKRDGNWRWMATGPEVLASTGTRMTAADAKIEALHQIKLWKRRRT